MHNRQTWNHKSPIFGFIIIFPKQLHFPLFRTQSRKCSHIAHITTHTTQTLEIHQIRSLLPRSSTATTTSETRGVSNERKILFVISAKISHVVLSTILRTVVCTLAFVGHFDLRYSTNTSKFQEFSINVFETRVFQTHFSL